MIARAHHHQTVSQTTGHVVPQIAFIGDFIKLAGEQIYRYKTVSASKSVPVARTQVGSAIVANHTNDRWRKR